MKAPAICMQKEKQVRQSMSPEELWQILQKMLSKTYLTLSPYRTAQILPGATG